MGARKLLAAGTEAGELSKMRTEVLALVALLVLGLGLVACQGEQEEVATGTATATVTPGPTVTASPTGMVTDCPADSIDRLMEIQALAPFQVYCPTFLPPGLTFRGAEYGAGVWVAVTAPTTLEATFVDETGTARVRFIQGYVDLASMLPWFSSTGVTIAYGDDLQAELWEAQPFALFAEGEPMLVAVATASDGSVHWVDVQGLSEEDLRQMAASMKPLTP